MSTEVIVADKPASCCSTCVNQRNYCTPAHVHSAARQATIEPTTYACTVADVLAVSITDDSAAGKQNMVAAPVAQRCQLLCQQRQGRCRPSSRVQCLRAAVQVNLNSVWSGMGLMENNLLGAQHETRLRVEELEDRCVPMTCMLCHALSVCRCVNTGTCSTNPADAPCQQALDHIRCCACQLGALRRQLSVTLFCLPMLHHEQRSQSQPCSACHRLGKLHKKLDVLIKLFISSLGPSQALMLSRQATIGPGAAAGGGGGVGTRSSFQAVSPSWQGRVGSAGPVGLAGIPAHNPNTPAAPVGPFLRHAMSALGQLPEQLTAVSGPLMGPALHLGTHPHHHYAGAGAGAGVDRGLSRRSGPSWGSVPPVTGGVLTQERPGVEAASGLSRASSGTAGHLNAAAAAAAVRGVGYSGRQIHSGYEQQSPRFEAQTGRGSYTGGLYSVGSGHIGPLLAHQQAWQLLAQQQFAHGDPAAQLGRARGLGQPGGMSTLTRSNSL